MKDGFYLIPRNARLYMIAALALLAYALWIAPFAPVGPQPEPEPAHEGDPQ